MILRPDQRPPRRKQGGFIWVGSGRFGSTGPAPSVVHRGTGTSGAATSHTLTIGATVPSGASVVWMFIGGVGTTISGMTDSAGNTYTEDYDNTGTQRVHFVSRHNITNSPTTFSFTTSSSVFIRVYWWVISNLATSSTLGVTDFENGTGTQPQNTYSVATADEIAISAMHLSSAQTHTADSPGTLNSGGGSQSQFGMDRATGAPGSYTSSATVAASVTWQSWTVTYKKA